MVRQSVEGKKDYLMISFQNKQNDLQTDKFLKDLNYIYDLVWYQYSDTHNVNPFIKSYNTHQYNEYQITRRYFDI